MKYINILKHLTAILFLIVGISNSAEAQFYKKSNGYDIIASNTGIPSLYGGILNDAAADLQIQLGECNYNNFTVMGCDFYPLLAYAEDQQGPAFQGLYDKAVQSMDASYESYVMITKEHFPDGTINYRTRIKYPTAGDALGDDDNAAKSTTLFDGLSAMELSAIESLTHKAVIEAAGAGSDNEHSEKAGLDKLNQFFKDICDGNFSMGCGEAAAESGFSEMAFIESFWLKSDGCDTPTTGGNVYDYACLKSYNTPIEDGVSAPNNDANRSSGIEDLGGNARSAIGYLSSLSAIESEQEEIAAFTPALIMTSCDMPDQEARYEQAEGIFSGLENDYVVWMHFDIADDFTATAYYKIKTNITAEQAQNNLDVSFEAKTTICTETESFDESTGLFRSSTGGCDGSYYDCGSADEVDCNDWKKWRAYCGCLTYDYLPKANPDPAFEIVSGMPCDCFNINGDDFEAGIAAGVTDGFMEMFSFLAKAGEGLTEAVVHVPFTFFWFKDTYKKIKEEGDFVKGLMSKLDSDAEYWSNVASFAAQIIGNASKIIDGIWESIETFFGHLLSEGAAEQGYAIGRLLFEVIFDGLTGGSMKIGKLSKEGLQSIGNLDFSNLSGLVVKYSDNAVNKAKLLKCKILGSGCFIADTPVLIAKPIRDTTLALSLASSMLVAAPIQDIQLLDYAVAHTSVNAGYGLSAENGNLYTGLFDKDPFTSDQQRERDQYTINTTDWYAVAFEALLGTSTCQLALHNDWIKEQHYKEGSIVEMNLPEQGIQGPFLITAIKHVLPQKQPTKEDNWDTDYDFKPITGIFTHESDDVWTLCFENGEELGVTYNHPIYSSTAGTWKLAGTLDIGEQVLTKSGTAILASKTPQEGTHTVYNLEVKELHNFLVGNDRVVVHNSCMGALFDFYKGMFRKEADVTHILRGHVNGAGLGSGVHHKSAFDHGTARIRPNTNPTDANAHGIYQAQVDVKDTGGVFREKPLPSTFFPDAWSEIEIMDNILHAWESRSFISGNTYRGYSINGNIEIHMFLRPDGSIQSAFPKL